MYYNSKNIKYAKLMRSNMTKEELILWTNIRAHRFLGLKFKRQVLIGNFIVDFLCPEKFLIIEIDGGQHNENISGDSVRTKYLQSQGYKIIRFWNNEINNNIEGVLESLKEVLQK